MLVYIKRHVLNVSFLFSGSLKAILYIYSRESLLNKTATSPKITQRHITPPPNNPHTTAIPVAHETRLPSDDTPAAPFQAA